MKPSGKSPRRPIKREYLATLIAAGPLDTWPNQLQSSGGRCVGRRGKVARLFGQMDVGLESTLLTTPTPVEFGAESADAAVNTIALPQKQRKAHRRHRVTVIKLGSNALPVGL